MRKHIFLSALLIIFPAVLGLLAACEQQPTGPSARPETTLPISTPEPTTPKPSPGPTTPVLTRTASEQFVSYLSTFVMETSAPPPIVPKSLRVSLDNRGIAYIEKVDEKMQVIVEDTSGRTQGKKYADIDVDSLTLSPGGNRLAYSASVDKKEYFVVVDGVEDRQYHLAHASPVFSPDSKRLAYIAIPAPPAYNTAFVVIDGKAAKKYGHVRSLVFSPDSRQVAYVASTTVNGNKMFAVIDGVEGKPYGLVADIVFSPDSRRVAYATMSTTTPPMGFAVVDGKEGREYDGVGEIRFSPDGKRVAYVASINKKPLVVVDGVEGKQYAGLNPPVFSPDSKRVAYTAWSGSDTFVVVDGIEGKKHYAIVGSPTFSPDSQQVAYIYRTFDGKRAVVVNGSEGKTYGGIFRVVFSPDSKHIAYPAETGNEQVVVIDGIEGKRYASIGPNSAYQYVIFDSSNALHYLAIKKDYGMYLVEETVGQSSPQQEGR